VLSSSTTLSFLDFEKSLAIALEGYTIPFGAVHINPKLGSNSERVLNDLTKALKRLGDELDRELIVKAWRSRDLCRGDKVDLLPDIIFTVNDWSCVVVKDPEKDFIYADSTYSPRHTGSHRLYGIFIGQGRDFKKGLRVEEISILDIAPTILYMFDAPIPSNIDGKILRELLKYGASREPKYVPPIYYRVRQIKQALVETR